MRTTIIAGALAASMFAADAASPTLTNILPRGGKRGAEHVLHFHGTRLADAAEIVFYTPGFKPGPIEVIDAKHLTAKIAIAPDCALGEHLVRVRTRSGLSPVMSFWVSQFDNTKEVEPNNAFASPQAIPFGTTVEGVILNEDVDHYVIDAKKGQRLSVEVEGIRLGNAFFDPHIAILNTGRFELAVSDDTSLLLQDPTLSIIAPADGKYIIQVRDASYTGSANFRYRLHVGSFPRPLTAFPAGGKAGTEITLKLLGDPAGEIAKKVKLPPLPTANFPLRAEVGGLFSPAPLPLRTSPYDNLIEAEPNNKRGEATKAASPLPIAFNGTISEDGDEDWFAFTAKKGQKFRFRAHAKSISSPLDPVINIYGPDKKHIVGNDDADGKQDSKADFTAAVDGVHTLRIRDHLRKGSPLHVYRIEAEPLTPTLSLSIPHSARNDSQSRQMIYVPRGGRFATRIVAKRSNFSSELTFEAPGIPAGTTLKAMPMHSSVNTFPVLFTAAADAPLGIALIDFVGRGKADGADVSGHFSQQIEFVTGQPANTVYYHTTAPKLAVAVVEKIPFTIDVEVPAVPLVRNGTLALKVVAKRDEGFTKAITLRNLWNPPGISSQPTVKIGEGKNETTYVLNANGGAALQTWNLAIMAESDAGDGQILTSSALFPITIDEPYLGMKIEMAAAEQGKPGVIIAKLEHHKPFEGTATIQLHGLPGKVVSKPIEITKATTELKFPFTTAADSPKGQHKNVFAHIGIPDKGAVVSHNIGHGGVLRIDPPPKKSAPEKIDEKTPTKTIKSAPKPLSRLAKLRQEAANK